MPHYILGMIAISLTATVAVAEVLTSSCEDQQRFDESSCRSHDNLHHSQFSECQIRATRNYANCTYRAAGL